METRKAKLKSLLEADWHGWVDALETKGKASTPRDEAELLRRRAAEITRAREAARAQASREALDRRAKEAIDELRPYSAQARLEAIVEQWDKDVHGGGGAPPPLLKARANMQTRPSARALPVIGQAQVAKRERTRIYLCGHLCGHLCMIGCETRNQIGAQCRHRNGLVVPLDWKA